MPPSPRRATISYRLAKTAPVSRGGPPHGALVLATVPPGRIGVRAGRLAPARREPVPGTSVGISASDGAEPAESASDPVRGLAMVPAIVSSFPEEAEWAHRC